MRLFFALALPEDARQKLAALIDDLRARSGEVPVTWVPGANLHGTLRFLGDVEDARVPLLHEGARDLATNMLRFKVTLEGVGTFGGQKSPRVIWVGMRDDPGRAALVRLAEGIERKVRTIGFEPADKPFAAHVTLARVKGERGSRRPRGGGAGLEKLSSAVAKAQLEPLEVAVDRFVLYESVLHGSRHPDYVENGSFPLA